MRHKNQWRVNMPPTVVIYIKRWEQVNWYRCRDLICPINRYIYIYCRMIPRDGIIQCTRFLLVQLLNFFIQHRVSASLFGLTALCFVGKRLVVCSCWMLLVCIFLQTVMEFRHPDGRVVAVVLPGRSLLVMKGESRYLWTHGWAELCH